MRSHPHPTVDSYDFGRIVIDGRTYTSDVIILPHEVRPDWWREAGHLLNIKDLSAVLDASPEVLVIGQGAHGLMLVPEATLQSLKDAGIETLCAPTAEAVRIYNERSDGEQTVAAALHLTC